jgi:hypothetical protein
MARIEGNDWPERWQAEGMLKQQERKLPEIEFSFFGATRKTDSVRSLLPVMWITTKH